MSRFNRLLAVLLVAWFAGPLGAMAASGPPFTGGVDLSPNPVTATGGATGRSLASKAADVIDVMAFGAKCDSDGAGNGTDDSAALNAALTAARAAVKTTLWQEVKVVIPQARRCLVKSTLNGTGFALPGLWIEGGVLDLQTAGTPGLDFLGSRFFRLDLDLSPLQANAPSIALQMGRNSSSSADFQDISHLRINGYCTVTCLLDFAAENVTLKNPYIYNRYSGAYAAVLDGYNHFNALSAFTSQADPVDTRQSMIGTNIVGGQLQSTNFPALWIGGTRQARLSNTYVANVATAAGGAPPITLWCLAGDPDCNIDLGLDVHEETGNATGSVLLSGTNTTPTMAGLRYNEPRMNPAGSIFAADTGVTSIALPNADIRVTGMPSPSQTLLDNPALYTLSGRVSLPTLGAWNEPANFTGTLCLQAPPIGEAGCVAYTPTEVINRNPDMTVDQANAGAGVQAGSNTQLVDGWRTRAAGAIGNVITFQQSTTSPPTGYPNILSTNAPSAYTPTAIQHYSFRSIIEGVDSAPLSWGNSQARYATFDYWVKCTSAPYVTNGFIQNNGGSRSYVFNNTVSAANVWQRMRNTIPGDTTGTWGTQRNRVGVVIGFGASVGANYQGTANAWQTGEFYGTSAGTNQAAVASTSCSYTGVHFRISPYHLPYLARSYARELQIAQHWYRKSFEAAVKPTQSAGPVGAATSVLQVAGVTAPPSQISFSPPMFDNNDTTPPLVTLFSTGAATSNCWDSAKAADAGAATAVNPSDAGFALICAAGAAAAGDQLQAHWAADSGF